MAVNTFGVTASSVKGHYFPHSADFSANSSPTSTIVGEMVDEAAADLAGKLLKESIDAAAITTTSSPEYLWCAKTLRLMVAIAVMRASTAQDASVVKAWQTELDARMKALEEDGGTALGNDALTTEPSDPDGPTDHIDEYGLSIGDPTVDASDVEPALRRKDAL